MKTHVFVCAAVLVMAFAAAQAMGEWSASVPVTELNTQYIEGYSSLAPDGLSLYFARNSGSSTYLRIYQATRSAASGQFTQVSEVSTLTRNAHICAPWVSPDNLRMYYQTTQSGTQKIRYTSRASTSDPWMPGTEVSEIDAYGNIFSMTLSSDERTASFMVYNGGSTYLNYLATRPDRNSAFDNISAVAALQNKGDPFLMPDGLTVYCTTGGQLYKATRPTTNDVFGNATMIPGFDNIRWPTLSTDGMTMYWTKQYFDQNNNLISNIYVSQYVPEPATMTLLVLGGLLLRRKIR